LTDSQYFHGCLTLGTLKDRPGSCFTALNQNLKNQLNQGQQLFSLAMQKAIVSGATKAFGQNMLQDQPQEVFALGGAAAGFSGKAFDIFEGDIAIMIGHDIVFADNAPV
jgi:hypothetical protein